MPFAHEERKEKAGAGAHALPPRELPLLLFQCTGRRSAPHAFSGQIGLLHRFGTKHLTGGASRNRGVVTEIEKLLGVRLQISDKAQLTGALGAALFALEL